jgi:hypothetical protein|tara:strand:+ start:927 stop:1118 length:192 start_codon:yes stop_codon:yes gene_type:complete
MKVGDMVRWTYPGNEDIGFAVRRWPNPEATSGDIIIQWVGEPEHSGPYPEFHAYLEVISVASS